MLICERALPPTYRDSVRANGWRSFRHASGFPRTPPSPTRTVNGEPRGGDIFPMRLWKTTSASAACRPVSSKSGSSVLDWSFAAILAARLSYMMASEGGWLCALCVRRVWCVGGYFHTTPRTGTGRVTKHPEFPGNFRGIKNKFCRYSGNSFPSDGNSRPRERAKCPYRGRSCTGAAECSGSYPLHYSRVVSGTYRVVP